ncbi:MAG TPA: cytochrome c biogenesis protein CcsA [Thermoanaerobaculia bacterium]|nr:cytochrome c biogenesis protein CcsA [Thermoanaerobaculia bacterium]
MNFDVTDTLYVALAAYALGTLTVLTSLIVRSMRLQYAALLLMIAGFAVHTFWIGTICVRTGHPPLTNLPESAAFLAWTIFAVELVLWIRYRVYAAAFFVYPLVLLLLTLTAVVGQPYRILDPDLQSTLFTAHIFLTTVGVAGLLIGLAFMILANVQDQALRSKKRGPLWKWTPSLNVCKVVSYRSLAIGFSVYTIGLITGVMWSYRTTAGFMDLRVKQVGAVVAWMLFAALLQTYISGAMSSRRTIYISAGAFVAIIVSILGIART